jgi:hypothetical protein
VRFYIPPNLQRDFSDSIEALGTESIINFDPLNKVKVRLDKVNYKTKNGTVNSDEVVFAELSSNLKMGDYLQYKNETMLITQLKENEFPKCYEFTTTTCNTKFTVTRYSEMVQDDDGNIITPEGYSDVVTDLYCSTIVGSFEFRASSGSIGIVPNNQLTVVCQFNTDTENLNIGDKFLWIKQTYQIISLDMSQLDILGDSGLLVFNAEKVI